MLIFWVIAGVALLLLVLTVVVGDFLDGAVDALDFTGGLPVVHGRAVVPGHVRHRRAACCWRRPTRACSSPSLAGVVAGAVVGAGAGVADPRADQRPTAHQITSSDYVGQAATVTTSIPSDGLGQISLVVAGQSTALAARADGRCPPAPA